MDRVPHKQQQAHAQIDNRWCQSSCPYNPWLRHFWKLLFLNVYLRFSSYDPWWHQFSIKNARQLHVSCNSARLHKALPFFKTFIITANIIYTWESSPPAKQHQGYIPPTCPRWCPRGNDGAWRTQHYLSLLWNEKHHRDFAYPAAVSATAHIYKYIHLKLLTSDHLEYIFYD